MKKGFTLLELLAVIVILSILVVLAVPKVTDILETAKIKTYQNNEEVIIKAAKNYLTFNEELLPKEIGQSKEITFEELENDKYMNQITDNKGICDGYILVTKTEEDFEYIPYMKCGENNTISSSTEDGLVANYTFDDFQEPTDNLFSLPNNLENYIWSKEPAITIYPNSLISPDGINYADEIKYGSTGYLYFHQYNLLNGDPGFLKNRTFTISAWFKGKEGGEIMRLEIRPHNNGDSIYYRKTVTLTKNWSLYHFTITIDSDNLNTQLAGLFLGQLNNTYYIWNPQFEEKPEPTPFTESIREGIIKDYSINNNTGNLDIETTPRWIEENNNGMYQFDGSKNQFIDLGESEDLKLNTGGTLSSWVNMNSWGGDSWSNTIIGKGYSSWLNHHYILFKYYGTHKLHLSISNGTNYLAGSGPQTKDLELNTWYHVVATWDDTNKCIYVDGQLQECIQSSIMPIDAAAPVSIGKTGNSGYYFNGKIDDVKVYNRALNEEEIEYDYLINKNNY